MSPRLLRAHALFGLPLPPPRHHPPQVSPLLAPLRDLAPGQIALLLGPSGCGKSSLLRALERRLTGHRPSPRPPNLPRRPLIDLLPGPLPHALSILAAAGLADATLLSHTPDQLSDGQRARLIIARAMARAPRWLFLDELASPLDRTTARALCLTLRRWLTHSRTRLIAATAHDDIEHFLQPDLVLRLSPTSPAP